MIQLETERLILRPFNENDTEDVFQYLEQPMVNCFACMKVNSLEEAKRAVQERAKNKELSFAIVLKESGKVIGEIEAMSEATAPDDANAVRDTFSPCWMLNKAYDSKEAQDLVKKLQSHITENYYLCTNEILAGLGQMYVADERF